jgi:hypothetical protein
MGCGASVPVDLSTINGGMTSGIGPVSEGQVGFILKQKMFSFSGDDFAIKNNLEEEIFKVKGKALSVRDKMHVTDAAGKKVAVLQRKLLAMRATFYIYSYQPNFDGQESTEKDMDGELLYRHAFVQDQVMSALGRQIVKIFVTSNEESSAVGSYEIFVQMAMRFKCRIKRYATPEEKSAGTEQVVIATAGETSFFQGEGGSRLGIEMCAGCDILLILLGMVASENGEDQGGQNE